MGHRNVGNAPLYGGLYPGKTCRHRGRCQSKQCNERTDGERMLPKRIAPQQQEHAHLDGKRAKQHSARRGGVFKRLGQPRRKRQLRRLHGGRRQQQKRDQRRVFPPQVVACPHGKKQAHITQAIYKKGFRRNAGRRFAVEDDEQK